MEALLNVALEYDPALEKFRAACQKITAFYTVERYPFLAEIDFLDDDVRDSLNQVIGLVEIVRTQVPSQTKSE